MIFRFELLFWMFLLSWFVILFLEEKENGLKRCFYLFVVFMNIVNVFNAYIEAYVRFK